jgi:hypothetical protein
MKLRNLVVAGMLVAAAMIVVSAPVAKADGVVDPRIILNAGGDPSCGGDGQPLCYQGGPISTVFNGVDLSQDFVYGCPDDQECTLAPLTSLELDLSNVGFGAPISCQSDVFVSCLINLIDPVIGPGNVVTFTAQVLFADTVNGLPVDVPSPCVNPYTQGQICNGVITQGTVIHEVILTPEPASIALLGAGLIGVFGFGRKRWMAARSI